MPQVFADLVRGADITGCRYMALGRMPVNAYDPTNKSTSTVQAKTGKVKHVYLTDEEAIFFEHMAAGKRSTDLLFTQQGGKPCVKSAQQPRMRAALKVAGIHRHVRFHDLGHTFATWQVTAGTSIQMVANQLGHASTRVAEEHDAHYSPSRIATTIRANKPKLVYGQWGSLEPKLPTARIRPALEHYNHIPPGGLGPRRAALSANVLQTLKKLLLTILFAI